MTPTAPKRVALFTHRNRTDTSTAVARLVEAAAAAGRELTAPPEEIDKHGLDGAVAPLGADPADDVDLAMVLGGDGTILHALRTFAGRQVPVFAINFGAIGFLATVDRPELEDGIRRAFAGDFDLLRMPALACDFDGETSIAVNDISLHRRAEARVAELAYSVEREQLAKVRCDGLVAATPAGSTGYNLANGGPVLAWGVAGFVVSFIAPHSLTARPLVVATDSVLRVQNVSREDSVDVSTDGRIVATLDPEQTLGVRFEDDRVLLAQVPGSSFYRRLGEKFGRLAY